jgi:septum formation protein
MQRKFKENSWDILNYTAVYNKHEFTTIFQEMIEGAASGATTCRLLLVYGGRIWYDYSVSPILYWKGLVWCMSNLILASQSPRRKELLQQIQLSFSVMSSNVDETVAPHLKPHEVVMELAMKKANEISKKHPDSYVLGSDTVVAHGDSILGKPQSEEEAKEMLTMLSGETHSVYTGVAILNGENQTIFYEKTDVTFWELTSTEIDGYIASEEPFDKAGAYGIQGLGAKLVKEIKGDYFSVVGLPLSRVYRALHEMGFLQ